MPLEWNATSLPWQNTALPWKAATISWNATTLPWKDTTGAGSAALPPAPGLSSPTATATAATTANIGVTTNGSTGTLYYVVTTSSTTPTEAQIKLGQDNSSVAAAYAGSQAISSTGAKTASATGLAASTGYTAHFMHEAQGGNQSAPVSSSAITTVTTWNPSDKGSGITLSNGNLTVTEASGGDWRNVRSIAVVSGTKYWEITCGSASLILVGIADATMALTSAMVSTSPAHSGTCGTGSQIYRDGGSTNDGANFLTGSPTTNDVIAFAVDTVNQKIWARLNGGNWNNSGAANPATNTGGFAIGFSGPYYAAAGVGDNGINLAAASASASWAGAAPSGFTQLA